MHACFGFCAWPRIAEEVDGASATLQEVAAPRTWKSTLYVYRCEIVGLCVCSYGSTVVVTALASGFQKRSLPLMEKLDEKVANCNNPALRKELISRIMWFLHRPILRVVREYPCTKSEVRAHHMARKLRSAGFTPRKSELSSHQMVPSVVVAHSSSWGSGCSLAFGLSVATPPKATVFGSDEFADFLKIDPALNIIAVFLGRLLNYGMGTIPSKRVPKYSGVWDTSTISTKRRA